MAVDPPSSVSPHRAPVPLAECALARAIETIGDGWTLLILREALCRVERFDAIRDDLGIPRSVLAERLNRLVAEGILEHRPYREPGRRPRKGYVLTTKGLALVPTLVALRHWAEGNLPGGRSRLRLQTPDGQEVFTCLMRADGSVLDDPADVTAAAS
ncbi:winged helix-turn-helix transcriptional regulator [Bosea sp. Root483D1]|uniref:winged helix-turn-helix transcriptional regulator n=1 Tax=Bosea sp. Root483D1 TaxID=1736544 RepID=UPI0009E793B7|nr:helix-turn-helix domain-containing protein [Bosea sp. Root483D1]